MTKSLSNLQQEEAAQNKRNIDLEGHIVSLKKELLSQQEKLDRATKQVEHCYLILIFLRMLFLPYIKLF